MQATAAIPALPVEDPLRSTVIGPPPSPPRPSAPPRPQAAPGRRRMVERLTGRIPVPSRVGMVGIAVIAVVLLVAIAALRQLATRTEDGQRSEQQRLLADAKRLMQVGSCEGAVLFAKQAAQGETEAEAETLLANCKVSLAAQGHLHAAWRAAAMGDRAGALKEARQVAQATRFSDDAQALIEELERQRPDADGVGVRLWRHAALGELGAARALVAELPPARRDEVSRELARLEERGRGGGGGAGVGESRRGGAPTSLKPFLSSLGTVVQRLEAGAFEDARSECRRLRAEAPSAQLDERLSALDGEIGELAGQYSDALRQVQAGSPSAPDAISKALSTCRALGLGGGIVARLNDSMADALSTRAQASAGAGNYAAARRDLLQAQQYDADSFPAAQGLRKLRTDAQEVLSDAELLAPRDGAKAARKFRQVVDMVGEGDSLGARAKKALGRLEN